MKISMLEKCTEAEFLDVIETKVLRAFLLALHRTYIQMIYANLKSDNYQDCAQKPSQNCTLMNSASVHT
jgi:hypothetical protein